MFYVFDTYLTNKIGVNFTFYFSTFLFWQMLGNAVIVIDLTVIIASIVSSVVNPCQPYIFFLNILFKLFSNIKNRKNCG